MQIHTHTVGFSLVDQGRAYLEYRMFSALSRFDLKDARLSVRLEEHTSARADARYRCVATLEIASGTHSQVTTVAEQLYAVIDRAAERLSADVGARLAAASAGVIGLPGIGCLTEDADRARREGES